MVNKGLNEPVLLAKSNWFVPWSGKPAVLLEGVEEYLSSRLPPGSADWLPEQISLLVEEDVDDQHVRFLLEGMTAQLDKEIMVWQKRFDWMARDAKVSTDELAAVRGRLRKLQPWTVFVSRDGGLSADEAPSVVRCSGALHHGVACWTNLHGNRVVSLLTSRESGRDWNWDADIGHECAHAAFGPVPIASTALEREAQQADLTTCRGKYSTPQNAARLCYLAAELAVVAIRAEQRFTVTGLPGLRSREELFAFLDGAEALAPGLGLGGLAEQLSRCAWPLPIYSGGFVLTLGAECLRLLDAVWGSANDPGSFLSQWLAFVLEVPTSSNPQPAMKLHGEWR